MMKKILFLLFIALVGWGTIAQAQLRLNGYTSYVFDDKFDNRYESNRYLRGRIEGGFQWGAGLEYMIAPDYGLELSYFRQDTEAPVNYYRDGDVFDVIDLGINYIMLGGNRYVETGSILEPYGGLMIGMVIYDNKDPKPGEANSATKFSWGARVGSNIWLADKIGLKVQAQLLSAVQAFGGSFYFGTGGSGAGINTYSTLFQFGLGGGIVIRMGAY